MAVDVDHFYAQLAARRELRECAQAQRVNRIRAAMMDREVRIALSDPSTSPLKLERLRQRLTVRELARSARLAPNTVSAAERGVVRSRAQTFKRLADALDVPYPEILPRGK